MLRGEPLTTVIPVRGGSKGIPRKNLYMLGGTSLLERAIIIAKKCVYVDQVVVSTDDREMHELAENHGVASPKLRPAHLASDNSQTVDVVLESLHSVGIVDGWVLLLQVTSPTRALSDLNRFLGEFDSSRLDVEGAVSLVAFDSPHPDKIQTIEDGLVKSYSGKESMVARQSLPKVYALNGAFYLTSIVALEKSKSFLSGPVLPYVMPREKSINLDAVEDLVLLEAMVERGLVSVEGWDVDSLNHGA